jgi:hypothetical protein
VKGEAVARPTRPASVRLSFIIGDGKETIEVWWCEIFSDMKVSDYG